MHAEAYEWIRAHARTAGVVLDIGGRDINGSPRLLFPGATYVVLDIMDGPEVDIVADAATWIPDREYDVVMCAEVAEHTAMWPQILATAHKALRTGGCLIVTCAGPGRQPHSAYDGDAVRPGEYYANVSASDLENVLNGLGFADIVVNELGPDVRAVATK